MSLVNKSSLTLAGSEPGLYLDLTILAPPYSCQMANTSSPFFSNTAPLSPDLVVKHRLPAAVDMEAELSHEDNQGRVSWPWTLLLFKLPLQLFLL